MSRKQDWTSRPRILGWVVVNLGHPDANPEGESGPAGVVAAESGYVWALQEDAEASAEDLRREFGNDRIIACPVLYPDQVRPSAAR